MARKQGAEPLIGDNSESADVQSVAGDQLKSFIERVQRLEEDKQAIVDDIKEVYGEAKANGFNVKVIRKIVAEARTGRAKWSEFYAIKDIYESALGIFA